jgi:hypothetical protein
MKCPPIQKWSQALYDEIGHKIPFPTIYVAFNGSNERME